VLALIDADGLIFSCGFSVEHKIYLVYGPGDDIPRASFRSKKDLKKYCLESPEGSQFVVEEIKEVEPLENCLHLVKMKLQSILDGAGATDYRVFIKGTGNFREAIAKTKPYKGNRDTSHRPVYESDIRQYLLKHWKAEPVDGQEVDDKVAQEQMKWFRFLRADVSMMGNTIICSPDKDLLQIPGWHYNYNTGEKFWVNELEATKFFYTQLLTGDASDNIQGIPGCGPVSAAKILGDSEDPKVLYTNVRNAYEEAYKETAEEVLNEMAQLLYIRKTEGVEWKPPL
jgi:hypothetical protein